MLRESPRVLHVVWNLIRGGTEGQCARAAMELARRGFVHRVAVFRREGFFLDAVERVCGPVREIGIRGMFQWSTARAIRRLAARLRDEQFDLLHTWDADAAIFGQFAAALAGVPLITSRRDLGQIYPPHKMWGLRRADRQAAAIVANARAIVEYFAARGAAREKFVVIPNLLDVQEFDEQAGRAFSRAADLPPGELIVMVARLDPEKDHRTFLRAAARVAAARRDVSFVLAGDGVERARLERMACDLGIAARVFFAGDITDVPALLRNATIGVLTPSRNEGLSNTILEYMAARLPVVATDCGGNRELVDPPRGGEIVPPGDDAALADCLVELLRDPERRRALGADNRRRVEREHTPSVVGDKFLSLYAAVAGSARRRAQRGAERTASARNPA
jgi:glycosyltransferase involved in cell wall biosynthesis